MKIHWTQVQTVGIFCKDRETRREIHSFWHYMVFLKPVYILSKKLAHGVPLFDTFGHLAQCINTDSSIYFFRLFKRSYLRYDFGVRYRVFNWILTDGRGKVNWEWAFLTLKTVCSGIFESNPLENRFLRNCTWCWFLRAMDCIRLNFLNLDQFNSSDYRGK